MAVRAGLASPAELEAFGRAGVLLEERPLCELKLNPSNPRTHSKAQLRQIARSIETFGFTNPVLIDDGGMVIAGHGRVAAAKLLGRSRVPVIRLSAMSEAQKRAYVIADNRLAEKAGWDSRLLAIELQYLSGLDLEFDVTVTGFDMGEIDISHWRGRGGRPEGGRDPRT